MGHTKHFYILLATDKEYGDFILRAAASKLNAASRATAASRFAAATIPRRDGWKDRKSIISPPQPELTGKLWN